MYTDFNEQYAYLDDEPFQRPLNATDSLSLKQLLEKNYIDDTTELFIFEIGDDRWYGVIATQLVYHEVAQGTTDGQPWVICFCPVCNAGSSFVPIVDDKHLTFAAQGIHHSMVLMADDQTNSYWDHLSGMCLIGEYTGKQLERIGSITSTNARNAVSKYPDLQLFVSKITDDEQADVEQMQQLRADEDWDGWRIQLFDTAKEDTRLSRLTMGLGVWTDDVSKFYSYTKLNSHNNIIFDTFDGRNLLVYLDPVTHVPSAVYTDADSAQWQRETLHLSNGDFVRQSVLYTSDQQPKDIELPLQIFIRWYAFAYKFPQPTIY